MRRHTNDVTGGRSRCAAASGMNRSQSCPLLRRNLCKSEWFFVIDSKSDTAQLVAKNLTNRSLAERLAEQKNAHEKRIAKRDWRLQPYSDVASACQPSHTSRSIAAPIAPDRSAAGS